MVYGDGGSGKSALTIRWVCDNFLDEYDPTIEDSYRKSMSVNNTPMLFDILDTGGKEEWPTMREQQIGEMDCVIIVLNLQSSRSVTEMAEFYIAQILKVDEAKPFILVGTKYDLKSAHTLEQRRHNENVFKSAVQLATKYKVPFVETSAKEKRNLHFLLMLCVYETWFQSTVPREHRVVASY